MKINCLTINNVKCKFNTSRYISWHKCNKFEHKCIFNAVDNFTKIIYWKNQFDFKFHAYYCHNLSCIRSLLIFCLRFQKSSNSVYVDFVKVYLSSVFKLQIDEKVKLGIMKSNSPTKSFNFYYLKKMSYILKAIYCLLSFTLFGKQSNKINCIF